MTFRRLMCLLTAVFMLTAAMPVHAEEPMIYVRSAPISRAADTLDGMVRVYLSSMGSLTSMDVTVVGSYSVDGAASLYLYDGQQVHFAFDTASGNIAMTVNGTTYAMGKELRLCRHQTSGGSALKIAQSNRPNNLYPGDLQLVARSSGNAYKLYPIVHVYIEYYLYGVVPYEMSSSWPIEALKAQSVAARTYTLNRMNGRGSYIYDLVDTSSDQVYNGYVGSETNATRAVDATRGIVIMNDGKLSGTYYTASNGGQTEAVANIWGSKLYPYLGVKDDPFDLANPSTNKRKLTVYSSFNASSQNSTLKSLLTSRAQGIYGSGVSIRSINSITPHTPKYAAPSRLYTKLDFGVTLSTGGNATLTFGIFDELEGALGLSINSSKNELWSVTRENGDFLITITRYGHGVGMSQRGAQQMANMGYTYDQILGFYYEGCERIQYTFTHTILPSVGSGDDPVVSTEAPATIAPGSDANARVQLVGVGDSLPLRYTASDTGKTLTVIPNGTSVSVVDYAASWTLIRYGEIVGYVPTSNLVITGTPPQSSGHSATNITQWASVTGSSSLNLRDSGSYSGNVIGSIPGGGIVVILDYGSTWSRVQYGQQVGYCMTSYLTLSNTYPASVSGSGSTAMVSLPGGIGSAPLRSTASTDGTIILFVDHGTQVTVYSNDGSWCRVSAAGVSGYMLTSALDFNATGTDATAPPLTGEEIYAIVASEASTLNLRSGPSTTYDIIAEIPKGTQIVVTSYGSDWCAIRWGSLTGYVMTMYLSFDTDAPSQSPATPSPTPTNVPVGSPAITLELSGLYTSPSTDSTMQLMLPPKQTVTVLSYGDTWTQVSYVGMTGYMLTSTLQLYQDMENASPTPSATPTPTPTPTATPSPTPVPTFKPANQPATVVLDAHLREEPNTGSTLLGSIPAGAEVTVTAIGSSWCEVAYNGMSGWLLTSQLHITEQPEEPESSPTPTITPAVTPVADEAFDGKPDAEKEGVVAWISSTVTSVNLRSAASTEAEIYTQIASAESITVLHEGETWSFVLYKGMTGYVFSQYITYAEPLSAIGVRYVNTAIDPLALRDKPTTSSTVLLRMRRGSVVTLLENLGDWCYVQYGQSKGYCATRYLSSEKPETHITDDTRLLDYTLTEVTGWEGVVKAKENGSIFTREWCSTEAPEVTELQHLTRVTLLQKGNIWCLITYEGEEGYCLTSQLELIGPEN
ncbi:MAG: SH3 domain-containing protein [Clostridia bacterium]|nr:SH3 domain-containing protein [Clostridia bacterium]